MSEYPTTIKPAPVFDLDLEAVGSALMMLPVIALRIGHESIRSTADYSGDPTPETAFVHDMLTLAPSAMAAKWYGGETNAGRFGAEVSASMMARARTTAKGIGGMREMFPGRAG